ncbi:ecotropic viral integration site 5 ortholog [Dermatophagoides farinae]|uniref:Tbc1 domain family member-like protein n=1 Tax=Dermatophagoides farinae TaxID=6954 RepID=A0A9D4P0H4_DERFA|nr:ecotropic viral integration site 5 ortholog-like [Dermatophagoides farinae]XP_046912027.1 ecotropic viral integration site 5 ortholog-like [Dermatophagoides farinae]KAH7641683.1 tbc1 domain family member-like protein [Dermatophagoides farinae]
MAAATTTIDPINENVSIEQQSKEKISNAELELLAKLEEQNRLLETDMKSLNSLHSVQSNHSRRSSETSEISNSEQLNQLCNGNADDIYQVWGQIVNDWANIYKKQKTLVQDLVRKGVPTNFRGLVWQLLCNVHNNRVVIREKYAPLLKLSSPCEKVIKRDIPRTFPEHEYFKEKDSIGQIGLFNVMKAYSIYDSEVGYCQGSAFVVGLLLLNMPEEDAFTVFQALMYDYRLREMFKPTMAELGLCIYQLECLVQELLPELYNHFQQQNFHTSMFASSWFLTLFTSNLPIHLSTRVMDLFLSEGIDIIFRLSIAILQLCRDDLLKLDMEGLLKYFQKEMPLRCDIDPDYLVHLAVNVKYDQKKMKKLSKDYQTIKAKEQEELVELRRLRTENRLLRQRIDNLEQESGELADKLIQGQVSRAQEAEDNFVIKRELAAAKLLEQELRGELEQAANNIIELKEKRELSQSLENKEHQQLIESLQEELIAVKLRDAENYEEMKTLRERIRQLEEEINHLRRLPADHATAKLQDELLAIKLREAEANLSIKELKEKIAELRTMWNEHMSAMHPESAESSQPNSLENGSNGNSLNSNSLNGTSTPLPSLSVTSSPLKILNAVKRSSDQAAEINKLKTELMSAKLREAEAFSDLKELRQKVMELETQNNVTMNQIRRQADEMKKLQEQYDDVLERERQAHTLLNKEKSKFSDLDFQMKEQQMMKRIKELEQTQLVAELRQKISSLETKIEEYVTKLKLSESDIEPQNSGELSDRMAELQTEMFRLDVTNKKLHTMQQQNLIEQNGEI